MADFSFSDDVEIQKLNQQVLEDPEEFEHWEKLVRAAESQEGGLNRNSSPGAIASTRDVYDKFLSRFPLFFGYWKKYADLEFSIAGTEAAEMVYERGVASIATSVDLWTNYCSFKVETSHEPEIIRELFERASNSAGLDFLAHPFWDKYVEFEERLENPDKIFAIFSRVIHIPLHQYARYFERYRNMAAHRPVSDLVPEGVLAQLRDDVLRDAGPKEMNERDLERELRSRIDNHHLDIFRKTEEETRKRWTYESEIKRPYYHVTELDEPQLANWRKYLDFEEVEGDYTRAKFLYERCLVTTANYEEFWLRYARWMYAQPGRSEEVRNIYERASCIYVPIARPNVRLFYAQFEESEGRAETAIAIHEAILMHIPTHVETIVSLTNVHRRQYGYDAAVEVLQKFINSPESDNYVRGALVSEWARMVWKVKGSAEEARQIYQSQQKQYLDSAAFWKNWLEFEALQLTSESKGSTCYDRVKTVYEAARWTSRLSPPMIKELSDMYLGFLKERGGKDAMKEFMVLDREINGPGKAVETGKEGHALGNGSL